MDRRNRVEWLVLTVSTVAVIGVIAVLIAEGLTGTGSPPEPVAVLHLDEAYRSPGGWLVPATVRNDGDQPARAVTLLASAAVNGKAEEAGVSIDYLPAGTEVDVTFGFSDDPNGEISIRVTGFLP